MIELETGPTSCSFAMRAALTISAILVFDLRRVPLGLLNEDGRRVYVG
ncbi:MAG: hypothetical protein ACRDP6_48445 [Actinoallomurus sp.]